MQIKLEHTSVLVLNVVVYDINQVMYEYGYRSECLEMLLCLD